MRWLAPLSLLCGVPEGLYVSGTVVSVKIQIIVTITLTFGQNAVQRSPVSWVGARYSGLLPAEPLGYCLLSAGCFPQNPHISSVGRVEEMSTSKRANLTGANPSL